MAATEIVTIAGPRTDQHRVRAAHVYRTCARRGGAAADCRLDACGTTATHLHRIDCDPTNDEGATDTL